MSVRREFIIPLERPTRPPGLQSAEFYAGLALRRKRGYLGRRSAYASVSADCHVHRCGHGGAGVATRMLNMPSVVKLLSRQLAAEGEGSRLLDARIHDRTRTRGQLELPSAPLRLPSRSGGNRAAALLALPCGTLLLEGVPA